MGHCMPAGMALRQLAMAGSAASRSVLVATRAPMYVLPRACGLVARSYGGDYGGDAAGDAAPLEGVYDAEWDRNCVNQVVLTGNVARDVTLRSVAPGVSVAQLGVGVYAGKDREGNKKTQWFDVEVFSPVAEEVQRRVSRGSQVVVHGRLQKAEWVDQATGDKRSAIRVRAASVGIIPRGGAADGQGTAFASPGALPPQQQQQHQDPQQVYGQPAYPDVFQQPQQQQAAQYYQPAPDQQPAGQYAGQYAPAASPAPWDSAPAADDAGYGAPVPQAPPAGAGPGVLERMPLPPQGFTEKEQLWLNLIQDPRQWWDNRRTKTGRQPDFKSKTGDNALWIDGRDTPAWVHSNLPPPPPPR